jgi:hypothetical protein
MLFAAAVAVSSAIVCGAVQAQPTVNDQTQACYAQARRLVLQGEALSNFMAQCTSGQVAPTRTSADSSQVCADRARLLSGEEKVSALRACAR